MSIQDILFPPKPQDADQPSHTEHGGHELKVSEVLDVGKLAITPHNISAQVFENVELAPAVLTPKPCSLAEADEAEAFAEKTATDVKNGIRKLRAAAKVRMSEAELQTGMRAYQAVAANAALLKAKANGRLATHLLKHRKEWAQLGYGTQRQISVTDQEVKNVRYRYLGA